MRPLSRSVLASILLFSLSVPLLARSRPAQRPATGIAAIDAIAQAALQRPLPGVEIAVGRGGQILHNRAYGHSDVAAGTALWSGSTFQIGSVTKQFTAAAILLLAERGRLSIDDPVTRWVPEFPTSGFNVTIRNLLNHTSGVPEYTSRLGDPYAPLAPAQVYGLIAGRPYAFAPGTSWEYSNTGYYTLGLVIERASGEPFAEFVRNELLVPFGLTSTGYCGAPPMGPAPSGYLEMNTVGQFERVSPIDMSLAFAAGALCSTGADLLRWNDALHHGRVLSPQSYALMTAQTRLAGGAMVGYGFGIGIGRDNRGRRLLGHGGSILGFLSALTYYPDSDTSIVVLVNLTSLTDAEIAVRISDDVADAVISP